MRHLELAQTKVGVKRLSAELCKPKEFDAEILGFIKSQIVKIVNG
jgi:hypothetical protein